MAIVYMTASIRQIKEGIRANYVEFVLVVRKRQILFAYFLGGFVS